jgi:hypothetical protein
MPETAKLLLPLRVPELGPSLGKLVTGTHRVIRGVSLDGVRTRLASTLIECAGEARRAAAADDRARAVHALNRAAWLSAWEEAVAATARVVLERVNPLLDAEARAVRMPGRRRREVLLDAAEQRALNARLGSAGAPLVAALDRLEGTGPGALNATPLTRGAMDDWQGALTTAARRLEAAWLALEDMAEAELARWAAVGEDIRRWRQPLWPVWLMLALCLPAAGWLGLILGGYRDAPAWLQQLWSRLPF